MRPCKAMDTESHQIDKKRILVIEDDNDLRMMFVQFLSSCGYEVFQVDRGDRGLQKTLELRPDLIMLDINLPGTMGTDLCDQIKSDTRIKNTPILLMTGDYKKLQDKIKGFNVGADDYIVKPVDLAVLSTRIKSILKMNPIE